ncbi:SNF1-related protein kinase catalytic subunit alpha KIN12 [Nilaparvata lugens]|uniref:SNF1-related protein kinase catalytic subunit alpha KIN12 n=1 Tax=Nilaparvata lugens TaxID=108931 RepID=UPI000B9868F8|nr:SNF1-related protein kinase catalytic subunit alpha KIN12 [Nilaparvata lugens]
MNMLPFHTVGNYRLTGKRLGKGNFSTVYQAHHTVLGSNVALKIISETKLQEDYVRKNLKREERLLAKLDHPCIIRLFETMYHKNVYCLVMEEARGSTLHQFVVKSCEGIFETQALTIAVQLFSAVDYMHSRSVVHRDLKMENVIYDRVTRKVKIVDFGLGNVWFGGRHLITQCGSPEYAAPELYTPGKRYGPEVDLWSLGIILFAMATGKLPFHFKGGGRVRNTSDRSHFLEQITRGLTDVHLKAIRKYSIHFSSLVSLLLKPNPRDRLTMARALVHPWLRKKQARQLKSSPSANVALSLASVPLTFVEQLVVEQMSRMLGFTVKNVLNEIEKKPYGKVGGVFNLMCWLKKR